MALALVITRFNSFVKTSASATALIAACLLAIPLCALAQYPGQVSTKSIDKKAPPTLRAISVYEWTGELDKPKACRLVPVMVYDGEHMQDATVYLARPEPMALAPEVEYELEQDGHAVELFDVKNAALVEGVWVGLGAPKALPKAKPVRAKKPQIQLDDFGESDRPVLHRKHPVQPSPDSKAPDSTSDKSSGSSTADTSNDDPDRPHLHRKPSTDSTASTASTDTTSSSGTGTSTTTSTPTSTPTTTSTDSGGPTLHRKDTSSDSSTASTTGSTTTANNDPDRPQLHRPKKKEVEGSVSSVDSIDPDRPRLRRGATGEFNLVVTPQLRGLPPDLEQAVAVSDIAQRPEHQWNFSWSNPDDAEKMKSSLEQTARDLLGMTPPPPPKPKSKVVSKQLHPKPQEPVEPPALGDENFHVFELSYGSGATLVLTATNAQTGPMLKYVTIIAQPDLYGNALVLFKQITDPDHLDATPRMRLVDAVDALADNRGELLFELRTTDDRQFALYRVLRGSAEKIFVSGGDLGSN